MPKIRVHQLAKELDIDSKIVMDVAYKHGIEVKNHMSALDTGAEFVLRSYLETERPKLPKPEPEPVAAEEPKSAKPAKKVTKAETAVAEPVAPEVPTTARPRTTKEIRVKSPHVEPPPPPPPAVEVDEPMEAPAETPMPEAASNAPASAPPTAPKPPERPAMRSVVARPLGAPTVPAGEPGTPEAPVRPAAPAA